MAQKRFAVLVLGVGSRVEAKFIRVRPTSRRWCMVPSELSLPSSLIESAIVFSFVQFGSCPNLFLPIFRSLCLSLSLFLSHLSFCLTLLYLPLCLSSSLSFWISIYFSLSISLSYFLYISLTFISLSLFPFFLLCWSPCFLEGCC